MFALEKERFPISSLFDSSSTNQLAWETEQEVLIKTAWNGKKSWPSIEQEKLKYLINLFEPTKNVGSSVYFSVQQQLDSVRKVQIPERESFLYKLHMVLVFHALLRW